MCILKSEMHTMTTINNVWNSEGDKKYVEVFLCWYLYGQTCVVLIYILSICEARNSQFFSPKKLTLEG